MPLTRIDVVTLFPEMIATSVGYGVIGRAIDRQIIQIGLCNPRDYTHDRHKTVDDRPYGGGPGMVMKYQPLHDAVTAAKLPGINSQVICLSPQGKPLNQARLAYAAMQMEQLVLVSGRYEGLDERFVELDCDDEWSIGDYVLSGGELPALVVIDAITRLLPGTLGDAESAVQDSYTAGLLDFPHYTRPETISGRAVPEVLLSGNHAMIDRWRTQQALGRTWQKRPDLL